MVLSLVNLCLITIRDCIEKGHISQVHQLPPKWHQTILDLILMHGTILKQPCLQTLTTPEFLRSFAALSTLYGRVNDNKFLDGVSRAINGKLSIDKSIDHIDQANRFSKLYLNLYATGAGDSEKHKSNIENFPNIVGLISKCPHLRALDLRFISISGSIELIDRSPVEVQNSVVRFLPISSTTTSSSWKPLEDGGFLNALPAYRSCLSILENLIDFSLITVESVGRRVPPLLTSHQPLIGFKKLSSLYLVGGTAYYDAWFHFLQSISGTLQFLHLENVEFHWGRQRNASVLPFQMPQLISLNAHGILSYCDSNFVKNLQKCTRLQSISLTLSGLESDENLSILSRIDALNEIRLNFRHGLFAERGLNEIVVKLVQFFASKITCFFYNGTRSADFKSACELLISECENLATLRLDTSASVVDFDQTSFLKPLFEHKRRARKLKDLELHGRLGPQILQSLFENCLYLDSLSIWDCPQLNDDHLEMWAYYGARPHTLKLIDCTKVGDRGLTSILEQCSFRLTHFRFTTSRQRTKMTEKTLRCLAECCRNVEWFCVEASICHDQMLTKIRKKSYKYPVKAVLI